MEEEYTEQEEAQKNPQEEETSKSADSEDGELSAEEIEDLKKKAEVSSQNFERAKKAEEELKKLKDKANEDKGDVTKETANELSAKDFLALNEKGITSQDFDEVMDYAKYRNVSISEALEDKTLQSILQTKKEERKTAEATHTQGGARGATKNDGASLLHKFRDTGEFPDDPDDLKKMFQAEIDEKRRR